MAATEFDILRDEQERSNLLKVIGDVETAIAVSTPGTRRVLENTVGNARKRITTLDKRIDESKVEHAAEVQAQMAAAAALAAKETKLDAKERESYRGFMEEAYFTKKDFGKLDEFYTHGYARLSKGGKDEMSKRIEEGIERGEFKATDLPDSVQKCEAAHNHKHLRTGPKENAGRMASDVGGAESQTTAENAIGEAINSNHPEAPSKMPIDFSSVDLTGIKLVAAASEPTAAMIPDASVTGGKMRS